MPTKIDITQLRKVDIIVSRTESKPSKAIFYLFMLLLLFMFGGCGTIYKTGFVPIPNQPISGAIEIGSEWIEIIPPKPLVSFTSTVISFRGIDYDSRKIALNDLEPLIVLKDGRRTKLEAVLYDNNGESYELRIAALGNGVDFQRKATYEIVNGKNEIKLHAFPSDRTFTMLKIRSQIPLKCDLIELVQYVAF
jgi:hypothetical protein